MATDEANPPLERLDIGPEQLRFIRSLQVRWSWMEAGAPRLTLLRPGSSDDDLLARVREVTGPWLVADEATLTAVYRQGMVAATAFVGHAVLAPGLYETSSPFSPSEIEQEPFATSARTQLKGRTLKMEVTAEHVALLKAANVRLFDDGGLHCEAAVDPKRPYGDMTRFTLDMGRILEVTPEGLAVPDAPDRREWSDEQVDWLRDLHVTTQPALQILLQHGQLPKTSFERHMPGSNRWV